MRPNQGRLGSGVVLDAQVLNAVRVRDHPAYERVNRRVAQLVEAGLPLVVSYLSLVATVLLIEQDFGPQAALATLQETGRVLNVILPDEDDILSAEVLLKNTTELSFEQAVAGVLARRLGCSIYGLIPGYHLLHIPVILD